MPLRRACLPSALSPPFSVLALTLPSAALPAFLSRYRYRCGWA